MGVFQGLVSAYGRAPEHPVRPDAVTAVGVAEAAVE
jgi:hypothetical protein